MADIYIKYNDEIILTITDENQESLKYNLCETGEINEQTNIEGWIKHTISHFPLKMIETCEQLIEKSAEPWLSSEEVTIPTDKVALRALIRSNPLYKNRDQRILDEINEQINNNIL